MQQPPLAPAPHPGIQQDSNKQHQSQQQSVQDHAEQDSTFTVLHEQLLAAQLQSASHPAPPPPRPQPGAPAHLQPAPGPRDHNIDPAISGAPPGPPPTGMIPQPVPAPVQAAPEVTAQNALGGESPPESRKNYGKRELSTSKRAAQNRAAQRAFRQRKEGYIRKLEEQVKEYEMVSENYKAIQAENYQLREYIISLQSRLIDSQNEVPELPSNIDLSQTRPPNLGIPAGTAGAPVTGPGDGGIAAASQPEQMNALNRIAVAGLGMRKHQHEEAAFLGNAANFQTNKRPRSDGQNDPSAYSMPTTSGDSNQPQKSESPQQSDMVP